MLKLSITVCRSEGGVRYFYDLNIKAELQCQWQQWDDLLPESDSNGELGYNQPYPWNLVLQGRDRNEVNRLMELARTDPETFNHLIRVLDANGDRLKLVKTDNGYLQNDGSIKAWGSINSVQILNPTVPAKINTEEWDLSFGELP